MTIATTEHFGKAAQILNIAQPALSRQMQALEAELDVPLFDRRQRGTRLTEAGRHFLGDAQRLLELYERARAEAQQVARGRLGRLSLGLIEVAAWRGAVPEAIRAFRATAPEVQLVLRSMSSVEQLAAIREGRLDGGFLYNGPVQDPDLGSLSLAQHRIRLAVPSGHPLANHAAVRLRDLSGLPLIWFDRSQSVDYHDGLVGKLEAAGVERNVVDVAENEAIMLTLVTSGLGCALVNEGQRWRAPAGVTMIPVEDLDLRLHLRLHWRRANDRPALARFCEVLLAARHDPDLGET